MTDSMRDADAVQGYISVLISIPCLRAQSITCGHVAVLRAPTLVM
jgi:hypothetical protein